jgi:hypothetical protein
MAKCEHTQIDADCDSCIDKLHEAILDIRSGGHGIVRLLAARIEAERELEKGRTQPCLRKLP